jgi:hypothetical protein
LQHPEQIPNQRDAGKLRGLPEIFEGFQKQMGVFLRELLLPCVVALQPFPVLHMFNKRNRMVVNRKYIYNIYIYKIHTVHKIHLESELINIANTVYNGDETWRGKSQTGVIKDLLEFWRMPK